MLVCHFLPSFHSLLLHTIYKPCRVPVEKNTVRSLDGWKLVIFGSHVVFEGWWFLIFFYFEGWWFFIFLYSGFQAGNANRCKKQLLYFDSNLLWSVQNNYPSSRIHESPLCPYMIISINKAFFLFTELSSLFEHVLLGGFYPPSACFSFICILDMDIADELLHQYASFSLH